MIQIYLELRNGSKKTLQAVSYEVGSSMLGVITEKELLYYNLRDVGLIKVTKGE